ncbi:sialidase family protein [Micromonospora echinospora]|uniref:sialidase family protein n=1 Tax=Micromonospora echinospora TaxID=1877 RepID=UPI0037A0A638
MNTYLRDARSRRLPTAFAVVIALIALVLSPVRAAHAEGVSNEVLVFPRSLSSVGDGIRTPDIVATSPTNVVTVWREGTIAGKHDIGSIKYAYSTDGGQTWSTPAFMKQMDSQYGWHYVILYEVGDTIYAFLGRAPASSTNGQPVTPMMMKSTDEGHTWTNHAANFSGAQPGIVVAGRPVKLGTQHVVPVWEGGKVGAMRSTDMVTWTGGAWAPDPDDTSPNEGQIVISPDDPGTLLMIARIYRDDVDDYLYGPVYAYTASSTDSGQTWSPLVEDPNIPNYQTKTYLTKSSSGQLLTIYNTFGSQFNGPATSRPPLFRGILNYKVKKPGQNWGPGRFFADGPAVVTGRPGSAGWDTYPMADEYAPGKYFVAWEHDTSGIKVNRLDVSDAFTNVNESWNAQGPWTTSPNGGSVVVSGGDLTLSNANSTQSAISQATAPDEGFILTMTGSLTDTSTLNTTTGVGANLAAEVSNGSRQLSVTVQSTGVYAKVSGQSAWQLVHPQSLGTASHQYRLIVSGSGVARLFIDAQDTGAQWTVPASTAAENIRLWVSGSATDAAAATVASVSLEENVASTTWDNLTGWSTFTGGGTVSTTGGKLTLNSPTTGENGVSLPLPEYCDMTLDFHAEVTDYSSFDPTNGQGNSLAVTAYNGSRRLMLSIQNDGVYAIRKGETDWTRVHTRTNAGSAASWRVDTNSGGEAKLYRNGTDTGARWTIQDDDRGAKVQVFSSGRSGNGSAANVDWLRTTCNMR